MRKLRSTLRYMDPRKLFVDERLTGICSYCGGPPDTRDHVPSRVLLDEPYPENLPVVAACRTCNESFSQDEEYIACFIECVMHGTAEPDLVESPKIKRILSNRPSLAARIRESRKEDAAGNIVWQADADRVRNVVLKLARGHMAFDLSLPHLEDPAIISFKPIVMMSEEELTAFESLRENELFPEVGSRAFISVCESPEGERHDWNVVQPGKYRYRVEQTLEGNDVRFVIREYLACQVIWM